MTDLNISQNFETLKSKFNQDCNVIMIKKCFLDVNYCLEIKSPDIHTSSKTKHGLL